MNRNSPTGRNKLHVVFIFFISITTLTSCAFRSVSRNKGIVYQEAQPAKNIRAMKLNVFAPGKKGTLKDVLIFIHGGNWNSGRPGIYSFLGNRLARKDVVAVIIQYPLSPQANVNDMTAATANAVKWVKDNIQSYGGDPNKIFISGHSAGGQLAALMVVKDEYFKNIGIANPLKGAVLIDAAGLDMYHYLQVENFADDHTYIKTFTKDQSVWKAASPVYFLHNNMPPMLIYVGGKTYPSIAEGNQTFLEKLKPYAPNTTFKLLPKRKHVGMIFQFINPYNPRYKEVIDFMKTGGK